MNTGEGMGRPVLVAGPGAWWMLAVLFLLYVVSFVDRLVVTMMVPAIQESLRLSDIQMGLVLGPAFAVCYAVFGFPLGWAADRFSRRWIIFLGALLFGLATAAAGLSTSFITLFLARACVGIGEASLSPAAYSLMGDRFPRHLMTTASAIYNTAAKVGTAGAYFVGGVAIVVAAGLDLSLPGYGQLEPWRVVFLMTGVPAVAIALLIFTFREPRSRAGAAGQLGSVPSLMDFVKAKRRMLIPLLAGFSLMGVCSFSLTAWVPTYLTREFELRPSEYGPILGAISVAAAAVLIFKGGIVDWLYSRGIKDAHIRFYSWLLMIAIPISLVMFLLKSPVVFMILYGIIQVICIPAVAYMSAVLQIIVPGNLRGRMTAVFLFCLTVAGGGVGPLLVGAITEYLFRDEMRVGTSIAIVIGTAIPLALLCFRLALAPLRTAVLEAERQTDAASTQRHNR